MLRRLRAPTVPAHVRMPAVTLAPTGRNDHAVRNKPELRSQKRCPLMNLDLQARIVEAPSDGKFKVQYFFRGHTNPKFQLQHSGSLELGFERA